MLEVLGRVQGNHPATIQYRQPIAQAVGFIHVVGRENHGGVLFLAQTQHHALDVLLRARVKTRSWLVEQQQHRRGQQRAGNGDFLLHAARHVLHRVERDLAADAQFVEHFQPASLRFLCAQAVQPSGVDQVLHRTQLLEERRVDAHAVDELLDAQLIADDVEAEDLERAAGAVGAQDTEDLALAHGERDVVDRHDAFGSCWTPPRQPQQRPASEDFGNSAQR